MPRATLGTFGHDATAAIPAMCENARRQLRDRHPVLLTLKRIDPDEDLTPRLIQLVSNKHWDNRWRAIEALPNYVSISEAKAVLTARFEYGSDEGLDYYHQSAKKTGYSDNGQEPGTNKQGTIVAPPVCRAKSRPEKS